MKKEQAKEKLSKMKNFFKDRKFQWIITILLIAAILIFSTTIRLSNIDTLKDSTTGNWSLADLDAQYFYRIAETQVANNGTLPAYDEMRSPGLKIEWLQELLPGFIISVYKIGKIFDPTMTVLYSAVISPVILYFLGMIIFFILCYLLTKSKLITTIASAFLAFSPAYLTRSVAGFADHDIMGMLAVFACFAIFAIGLKKFEKSWKNTIIYGILLGFFTVLVLTSWGGAITFVITVIPFAFFLVYLLEKVSKRKILGFYFAFIISSIIFPLIFNYPLSSMIGRFEGSYGLIVPFVLGFMIIDTLFGEILKKEHLLKKIKRKYQKIYSLIITGVLGSIGLIFIGRNILTVLSDIWYKLLFPFGSKISRLESTVAENSQPYLTDWINQTSAGVFYLFIIGLIFLGIELTRNIEEKKYKSLMSFSWVYLVCSILFSRISSSGVLNGENTLSRLFYLSGLIFFFVTLLITSIKCEFKNDYTFYLLISLMFFTLVNGRSAVRIFLLITPFVVLSGAYAIKEFLKYGEKVKDETLKIVLIILSIALIIFAGFQLYQNVSVTSTQAKYIGSSTDYQWQNSLKWMRENTNSKDIFVHWWDYGYWIQTIAHRPTVTDGGHAGGNGADHFIGRYILTTPNPITALSYMKTWNVSYLLIDSTDFGKYGAYSKIGSDKDYDRFSFPAIGVVDEAQTIETANSIKSIYSFGTIVDEDINYNGTFLPGPTYDSAQRPSYKSYFLGAIVTMTQAGKDARISQPEGVYSYNNKQYRLPIRYIYINGEIQDFGSGVDAVLMIIPRLDQNSQGGTSVKPLGAGIYLSPKVQKGLYARLYLMNDPFNQYSTLKIVHTESDYVSDYLKMQGINAEIVYYNGFRGPIKIWEVDYPSNTKTHEELLSQSIPNEFGGLDYLFK